MNKKTRMIIIFSLLIIAIYIGFKYYCYKKYEPSENLKLSNIKITGKMSINHIDLDDSEYISFKNLKFKNIFDGFERIDEETEMYKMVLKDENGEINKGIFIGSNYQYIDLINYDEEYKSLSNSVIKKENIKDDVDFINYLEKHNYDIVKFFMTTKRQKQIYLINKLKEEILPSIEYIKEIDGYYRGYIFKTNKRIFEINIISNNKKYYFIFIGNYNEEFINDFVNTVVII